MSYKAVRVTDMRENGVFILKRSTGEVKRVQELVQESEKMCMFLN